MSNHIYSTIANTLGISKATVSKAIRHCGGVDMETRLRILREAMHLDLQPTGQAQIYCILPDTPRYFWNPLLRGIMDGVDTGHAPVKFNMITRVRDTSTAELYIEEARHVGAQVILLTAAVTPAIRDRLQAYLPHTCIILLSECGYAENTFYIGSNAYRDGYHMGELCHHIDGDRQLLILDAPLNENMEARLCGFRQALADLSPDWAASAVSIPLDSTLLHNFKTAPAHLAALLTSYKTVSDRFCLYSPTGLPQLALALQKAGLSDRTICLAHDLPVTDNTLPAGIHALCNQDLYQQGSVAIRVANTFVRTGQFPPAKRQWVDSTFRRATYTK